MANRESKYMSNMQSRNLKIKYHKLYLNLKYLIRLTIMQSLTIFIILLSLIGIYINLSGKTHLADPEFHKIKEVIYEQGDMQDKNLNEISTNENIDKIIKSLDNEDETNVAEEPAEKKVYYNEIGEKIESMGDGGLKAGNIPINSRVDLGKAPSAKVMGYSRPSNFVLDDNNLKVDNTTYDNLSFPYKSNSFKLEGADSRISNITNVYAKNPKGSAQVGAIVLPKDESDFSENMKYINRAVAIYRNGISNQNKLLPDVSTISSAAIQERGTKKLGYEIPDYIDIKSRPDMVGFVDNVEHMRSHEILKPFDIKGTEMKNVSKNYNLK